MSRRPFVLSAHCTSPSSTISLCMPERIDNCRYLAKLHAFVRRMPPTTRSRPANSRPSQDTSRHYTTRIRTDAMTVKSFLFNPSSQSPLPSRPLQIGTQTVSISLPVLPPPNRDCPHSNRDCPHFDLCFVAHSPIFCNLSLFLAGTVPKSGHGNTPNSPMSFADKNIRH